MGLSRIALAQCRSKSFIKRTWGASRRDPMDQVWDLVAGTFIAVSVLTGMAFIIVSAIR
jgi:hypothetical protein